MKSYTDLEQSKKLAKILPIDSADDYYSWHDERYYVVNKDCPYPYSLKEKIPCWSLASLLGVLPKGTMLVKTTGGEYYYLAKDIMTKHYDNPIDTCVEIIERLNELKML